jgi:CRP/FNR family transcriptional regulator
VLPGAAYDPFIAFTPYQEFPMFALPQIASSPAIPSALRPSHASAGAADRLASQAQREAVADTLQLLVRTLEPQKRLVRAGDVIYRAGDAFDCLYILNSGLVKIVKLTSDGREQVVGLKFRGDWLGFDGIARVGYGCDAVAMDTGEVWAVRYDALLASCGRHPALLTALHEAMSRVISRERDTLMSVCTLPADARVANFLHDWAQSLGTRGLRTDQITLRMTRAEIGNYLGLTLESVSRALSKLAREEMISFVEKGRREVRIPDLDALAEFVQRALCVERVVLQ